MYRFQQEEASYKMGEQHGLAWKSDFNWYSTLLRGIPIVYLAIE